ncbi:solute carrier family 49 member 4 homolog [Asterias rubens]|uniref:solute carrier family 49 member 4 homolog n=1 Tax=Asterias rubens TaxID=7604 RepID=UPI0014556AE6|nr:solute carrier family 49 member 4 homolog [Asterias rubens]
MADRDSLLPQAPPIKSVQRSTLDPGEADHSQPNINYSVNEDHSEDTVKQTEYKTYKGRWYILAVFSLLGCLQACSWNTWGPIADTAKVVLDWDNGDIALLSNWGPIAFVLAGFYVSYLLLVKGLRFTVLGSSLILLLGVCIRCLPVGIDNIKWTMNIGHVGIGLAGPVLMAAPTAVSSVWFPPHQRTTSTAISVSAVALGIGASFLIGPYFVTSVPENTSSANLDPAKRKQYFSEIMTLMYVECGATAIVVIAALLYFPNKPPTSPSVTASKPRESFKEGAIKMIKSGNFWIPAFAYSLTTGVYSGWTTQMPIILSQTLDVGQNVAGWIGFISNVAIIITSPMAARFVDLIGGRMKAVLLVFLVGSCLSCVWVALLTMEYITYNVVSLYIACIATGLCVNSPVPIYFELTAEGVYPVSEANSTMVMAFMNNVACLIFLLIFMIPNIGVTWMTWCLLGSVAICIPLLLMYKERYNRLDLDTTKDTRHVDA